LQSIDGVLAEAAPAPARRTNASPLNMLTTPRTAPKAVKRFNGSVRLANLSPPVLAAAAYDPTEARAYPPSTNPEIPVPKQNPNAPHSGHLLTHRSH
jgi:hypothetical protein